MLWGSDHIQWPDKTPEHAHWPVHTAAKDHAYDAQRSLTSASSRTLYPVELL
jgi:hypothetical protein